MNGAKSQAAKYDLCWYFLSHRCPHTYHYDYHRARLISGQSIDGNAGVPQHQPLNFPQKSVTPPTASPLHLLASSIKAELAQTCRHTCYDRCNRALHCSRCAIPARIIFTPTGTGASLGIAGRSAWCAVLVFIEQKRR